MTGWIDGDLRGFLMGAFNVTRARGTEFVVLLGDAYGRHASYFHLGFFSASCQENLLLLRRTRNFKTKAIEN